jgi:hypothetical protein
MMNRILFFTGVPKAARACAKAEQQDIASPHSILTDEDLLDIHPRDIRNYIKTLRAKFKNLVWYTLNPYALDAMIEKDKLWICATRADGTHVARQVTDHPEWKRWSEAMDYGEFWTHVGEDWVLE